MNATVIPRTHTVRVTVIPRTHTVRVTVIPRTHTVRVTVSQAVLHIAQKNLYELAKEDGFTGTFAEFLESLKSPMTWASTNW